MLKSFAICLAFAIQVEQGLVEETESPADELMEGANTIDNEEGQDLSQIDEDNDRKHLLKKHHRIIKKILRKGYGRHSIKVIKKILKKSLKAKINKKKAMKKKLKKHSKAKK